MKKIDLEKAIAKEFDCSNKEAANILEKVSTIIFESALETGDAPFGKFGKFKKVRTAERSGIMKGVDWVSPAHNTLKFSLSKYGKETI